MTDYEIVQGEHIFLCGQTGSGKTYFEIEAIIKNAARVVVVDSEYVKNPTVPDQFAGMDLVSPDNERLYKKIIRSDKPFHVRVPLDATEDDTERLSQLCKWTLEEGHDLFFVVDEVADFSSPSVIPEGLKLIVRKGRKRRISVVVGTQRPQDANKEFTTQSTHQFWFFLTPEECARWKEYANHLPELMTKVSKSKHNFVYHSTADEDYWVVGEAI